MLTAQFPIEVKDYATELLQKGAYNHNVEEQRKKESMELGQKINQNRDQKPDQYEPDWK